MWLQQGDLLIRNASEGDSVQLARWWNDGQVMVHAGFPNGLGTTPEKVAEQLKGDTDETYRRLMVERAGRPIGEMSCRNLGAGTAEIGIKTCDPFEQNKGSGRVLLSMLIRKLFACGYKKIVLDTNLSHTRAQHVYEKLGFQKVRVNMDAWEDQLGRKQSPVDYVLLKNRFVSFVKQDAQ